MESAAATAQLQSWGIPDETAKAAGLFEVADAAAIYPEMQPGPGIVIPYYDVDGQLVQCWIDGKQRPFARVRLLESQEKMGFVKAKPLRYLQPKGTAPEVYFPPFLDWRAVMANPQIPIIMTEGEAKGIHGCMHGFQVIALGGVFNFTTPGGKLMPQLDAFNWERRDVYIVFDSDAATNPNVLAAEARLVYELQRERGAFCHIVRLPKTGNEKTGLDDYLKLHGPEAFVKLLTASAALSALDSKIIELNNSCAWIEREGMVYDLKNKLFIQAGKFVKGSQYSARKHVTVSGPRGAPKEVSVADEWLTHTHAQRYAEILFRPGEGITVRGEHGLALNMWTGWEGEPGDITPWLRLGEHLFSKVDKKWRDLPLKLMAYKVQNPQKKIPLALVLIGPQGSGKNLWADSLRAAMAPYAANVTPASLTSEFQGWLETSLLATIHEIKPDQMRYSSETLKALISDMCRPMNEKYRPARDIFSYTFYIFTSNLRGVAAFAGDDRRYIVADIPGPGPESLYADMLAWIDAGGPNHLLHYLQHLDLKGWVPPQRAPLTPEKYMAYEESLTPIQKLAEEMQNASAPVIVQWLDSAMQWSREAEISNNTSVAARARAVAQTVKSYQIRPWYTPEELSLMFPAIVEMLLGSKYQNATPAGMVSRQLREAGVPYLVNRDDPKGFRWGGQLRQYLVIGDFEEWAAPITQVDFERQMRSWPTYDEWKRNQK